MPSLKELQEKMLSDLLTKNTNVDYLFHPERMEVYSDGYVARLRDAMSTDFPITKWSLGESAFNGLIWKYIEKYPTRNYNINLASVNFPGFIHNDLEGLQPWLSDLVAYEAHLVQCEMQPHLPPVNIEQFRSIPIEQWSDAKFRFQPHMILQLSNWDILKLDEAYEKKEPFQNNLLVQTETPLIFYQRGDRNYCAIIEKSEFSALKLLSEGQTLGDTIEILEKENIAEAIFNWFQQWGSVELLTTITFESHES